MSAKNVYSPLDKLIYSSGINSSVIYLLRAEGRLSVIKLRDGDPFKDKPLNLDVARETGALPKNGRLSSRSSSRDSSGKKRLVVKKSGAGNSREKMNDSMYDLKIQGEDDPGYDEKVAKQRLNRKTPKYVTDNDLYNSEKILRAENKLQSKQVRQLKDGQQVFTSSRAIHRDDFVAVSLREEEPEKKEGEVEVEEPVNPYPETDRDGKPIAPIGGEKPLETQKIKITTTQTPLVKKQVKFDQDSAYETKWDSQHYNDDVKRSSRAPVDRTKDSCCTLL